MKRPRKKGEPPEMPPPPGGRALERLRQFEMERGIGETEPPETPPEECETREKGKPQPKKQARKRSGGGPP